MMPVDTICQTIAGNLTTGILEALPGIPIKAEELLAGWICTEGIENQACNTPA